MTIPCDKGPVLDLMCDDIKEMKADVKLLLAVHNKKIGASKFKKKIVKTLVTLFTIGSAIVGAIKYK